MALSDIRKSYEAGALNEAEVAADPVEQFQKWLDEALDSDIMEATAMTLATADANGRPSARTVLLKDVGENGFVFYSNYKSRKGRDLAENPHAALTFYWDALERQVRVEGRVGKLSREASEAYFHSRPRGSQLGALASNQSEVIESREVLEQHIQTLDETYPDEIPLPNDWGGYALTPEVIEFWQGRPNRVHDRLRYIRDKEGWGLERLSP